MNNSALKGNGSNLFPILMCCIILFMWIGCRGDGGDKDVDLQNQDNDVQYSFGIHPSSEDDYSYARDLGIDFNRDGVYFVWDWVDPDRNGNFMFKNATASSTPDKPGGHVNYDNERQRLLSVEDIVLMNNVSPFRGGELLKGEFQNEEEKVIYQTFVEKMVERYDGDSDLGCTQTNGIDCYNPGDKEYPAQNLITILESNPIKYWQVCNQVTDVCSGPDCQFNDLYAQKYAEVMKLTYRGIKTSCPDCEVLMAGDSAKELYPPVYNILMGEYIDIVDKHFFGAQGEYVNVPEEMDYLKYSLEEAGFDLDKLKFWISEIGTYSGDPVDDRDVPDALKKDPPYQTEQEQAQELIKRYAVAFGYGIEKVLWAWGTKEGFSCNCCMFDYTGLIYDGNQESQSCDENDPYDRGDGVKKLAYYTFKLMTQKLKGFTFVETIQNSNGTYVYKFVKDSIPVYVAWSENEESLILTELSSNSVKITKAVPSYEFGDQVVDFNSAFASQTEDVSSGKITINLDANPIFIEENY
ncbi:MAG: hypothetical protein KKB30_11210 [Proteobacteria bacterium]|nr:hypothetical protein [Pseudomonadota bacterium]MBU1714335.1 hypothetical protein [Pseudomonadota bacterium]